MKGDLNLQTDGARWAPGKLGLEKSLAEYSSINCRASIVRNPWTSKQKITLPIREVNLASNFSMVTFNAERPGMMPAEDSLKGM